MSRLSVGGRKAVVLGVVIGVLVAVGALAPQAGAVLVHIGHGRVAGVTPVRGVNPASIPGSFAHRTRGASNAADTGQLDYHNGAVLHAEKPFVVFWDPSGEFSAAQRTLFVRYFADSAADSGRATNVFSVDRQFTDTTGFADYNQTWAANHEIDDTQPYPTTGNCTENAGFTETTCLFDSQIQAEVQRLVTADGLPNGLSGAAPIYFVVTPPDVNSCFDAPKQTTCADNMFCAYHANFFNGTQTTTLYADIPTILAANNPKGCQFDNTNAVQSPNASPLIDVTLKYTSHEFNETITDPTGQGWWDNSSGNEDGDECNFYGATADPFNDKNPNAFLPTLGGSASAGTLFDQVINGNHYYTQSEWSNAGLDCRMEADSSHALTAAFSAPTTAPAGTPVSFDPTGSSSAGGFSSTTWDFGDGSAGSFAAAAPAVLTHTFNAAGTFTVRLTVVDAFGNLQTVTHSITITHGQPVASFTATPTTVGAGAPVSFDGSSSHEPGGSIVSYSWDFGDGTPAGSGATTSHTYATAGTYTVKLTVTDQSGATDSTTHTVTVVSGPVARFTASPTTASAGSPVSFDGSGSTDTGSTISSYTWDFGDGTPAGTGATTTHTYAAAGTYTVTLTVTDHSGQSNSTNQMVAVGSVPAATFTLSPTTVGAGAPAFFDGSGSTDTGSTIASYSWDFGDGTPAASGAMASHIYAAAGTYTVTLTVLDQSGSSSSTGQQITVVGVPVAKFTLPTTVEGPVVGVPLSFDGSGSTDTGSTITSYSWNFGDGGAGKGVSPTHTFTKSGTFNVTLTITDASGRISSTTGPVSVVNPTIFSLAVAKGKKVEQVKLLLTGPGTLKVGSQQLTITGPGPVTIKVKLTKSQRKQLARRHKLTVSVKLVFTPISGPTLTKTVKIKLKT
jgi:PKD repeat protein